MKEKNKYFIFYNSVKLVNGKEQDLLYDLDKSEIHLVSKEFKIGTPKKSKNVIEVNENNFQLINQFFLNNFGIYSSFYPNYIISDNPIDEFCLPYDILTINLEYSGIFNFQALLQKFPNVANLVLVIDEELDEIEFGELLNLVEINPKVVNLEIFIRQGRFVSDLISEKYFSNFKISKVVVYGAMENQVKTIRLNKVKIINIIFLKSDKNNEDTDFIEIRPEYFAINRISYFIALKYNLFHFKKYFINKEGFLMAGNFKYKKLGNINDFTNLLNIVNNVTLDELQVSKDLLIDCDDSPFRYCCNDPRIPSFDTSLNKFKYKEGCLCKKYI